MSIRDADIPVIPTAPAASGEKALATHYPAQRDRVRPSMPVRRHTHLTLLQRVFAFFARLFAIPTKAAKPFEARPASAEVPKIPAVSETIVFKGGTAITLVTPMGAYAGKPAQQRMLKLAEQQFQQMDVSKTTMN